MSQTGLGRAGIGNKILMFGKIKKTKQKTTTHFSVLNARCLMSFNELAETDLNETTLTIYRPSFHSGA